MQSRSLTLTAGLFLTLVGRASAQSLSPGEIVIGSRAVGAVIGPVLPTGHMRHISGRDMSVSGLPLRGSGTELSGPHLALLALGPNRLIAAASTRQGRYSIDLVTGNRTLLPGTGGAPWTGEGDMLAIDSDSFLAIADDFTAASTGDGKILQYTIATGQTVLISGIARGDGVVMHRPRSITRLDASTVAVVEFGPVGAPLPGAIVYRVDLVTGNRSLITTLTPDTPYRYTATGGVRSASPSAVPPRGTGPVFKLGHRGMCFVGGRLFVAGTADDTYVGGIVEVDLATGDRTLMGGAAYAGSTRVTRDFGPGSDPYVADGPTSLTPLGGSSFVFTETFGPNKVWKFDIDTRRVRAVADLNGHILPPYQAGALITGLTVTPCGGGPDFEITQQPVDTAVCKGAATFSLALSTAGPFDYQWLKDGEPIDASTNPSAQRGTLVIDNAQARDAGSYTCAITNPCGTRTTESAVLEVCLADIDCSRFVDTDDFTAFVLAFEEGTDDADIDASGFVDTDDFTAFVLAFEAGC